MSPILANNYFALQGEVALITGASSGLGRHFAGLLASAGVTVGIAARRESRLLDLVEEIEQTGGRAVPLIMDVTDADSVSAGLSRLVEHAGPVSLLVNNAGIATSHNFIDADLDAVRDVFATNQMAAWMVAQQICRHMQAHKVSGRIINIASIGGLRTMGGASSYAVSKAAVVQLTKIMAMEMARSDIRVNAIAPGYISTEMNADFLVSPAGQKLIGRSPMRRVGSPEDLDGTLLLLASSKNAFMTGAVIPVDGGHLVASL